MSDAAETTRLLSLLQFADGLFPAGAYAHSMGLETYAQDGRVKDEGSLGHFLRAHLEGSCAPSDGIAAVCAHRAAIAGNFAVCLELDEKLEAMKAASELRVASRQMGRQTLRVAREIARASAREIAKDQLLDRLAAAVESGAAPGHHAIVFGIVGGAMEWPARAMAAGFLYASSTALVGAALRLMPLGQTAGQRALASVQPLIARLAEEIENKNEEDMVSFAPALEIAAMRHETLDARLFRS
ncbi:MAG: urease accessory protein UreF [Candidatus Acidiferrales bacterium]